MVVARLCVQERPYPSRATITLRGLPHVDLELPMYGSKVIAVRDGNLVLHGLHKRPTWSQLAATANPGDTSITLAEPVNWSVGDRIVIASSSFYPDHVDEANIVSVSAPGLGGGSVLVLDAPLRYTHLGERFTGPDGRVVDMRAEVGVLSRNVVVQGDGASEALQFGGTVLANTPATRPRALLLLEQTEFRCGAGWGRVVGACGWAMVINALEWPWALCLAGWHQFPRSHK